MKKILVVLIALLALTAFVACDSSPGSTPKPTPAPSAGEIPVIPSSDTPIKEVDEEAKEVIATVIEDLIELFNPSKLASENKAPSLDGSVVISAKANSITVGEDTLSFPAFSATIKEEDGKIALKFKVKVKENYEFRDVEAEFNLITGEAVYKVGPDTLEVKNNPETDVREYYLNGNLCEDSDQYSDMIAFTAEVAILALSDSTIEFLGNPTTFTFDNKVISAKGKVTINADIIKAENLYVSFVDKSSGIEANAVCNATITAEDVSLIGSEIKGKGKVSIPNISVYASLSEDIEASFDLKDLEIELDFKHTNSEDPYSENEDISLTMGWKELAVSAHMANTYVCNIKSSDGSLGLEYSYSYSYDNENEIEARSFKVNSKESLGIGLKDNRNSVGLVADLIIAIDSDNIESQSSPIDSLVIDPKAAVINGAYYNPEALVDAVMEAIFNLAAEE